MVYAYTKLKQELNNEEEKRLWFKSRPDERLAQEFFLPKRLIDDRKQEWIRSDGASTICYNTYKIHFNEYHITISKDDIPGELSLHETTPKTKGLPDKNSTFIVQDNGTLQWDGKSAKPSDDINNLVGSIVQYQHDRYKKLILESKIVSPLAKFSDFTPHSDIDTQKSSNTEQSSGSSKKGRGNFTYNKELEKPKEPDYKRSRHK
ncbi:MAG: hypothetical protein ACR2HS_01115 [Gammaproteobacteria bacterium]